MLREIIQMQKSTCVWFYSCFCVTMAELCDLKGFGNLKASPRCATLARGLF